MAAVSHEGIHSVGSLFNRARTPLLASMSAEVDAAEIKPNDRQRLADELSRLSGEAQWFADQVSKGRAG